ncbi:forespore regulator of the sigma-K checkpoint [Paenibacillus sp. UNC496MF]|uniref:BofC C-terminal domain-containing protein n=1 Tax=Paenibacillus sp. UNC496MF TaxID=1502753 RepID=UPI0008EECDDC|nr:BofC C-terminal domain-containing protein [Paenibacillus sp. UNC496MF]SFJ10020.1 forespore regulator of the sigma-K checkpoint [Paenibacillus sp. UNC496MF]
MMTFNVWRKVKQKLRRGRRPMWQLACFWLAAGLLALSGPQAGSAAAEPGAPAAAAEPDDGSRSVIGALSDMRATVTVKLRRVYICGEESETIGSLSSADALRMMKQHPEWTAMLDEQGAVVMEQRIDDLSDACKRSAYFGLDKLGRLSLFDGEPKKEKVMRTFFQLDVNYMESSLPRERIDELVKGIRVTDKDDFNSVLSTFSDYAVERTEKVMKRTL